MVDSVEHVEPTGDVVILITNAADVYTAMLVNGAAHEVFGLVDGRITIPLADFTNAITNHAVITLRRNITEYGGSITFLPEQESEEFPLYKKIELDGSVTDAETIHCTELLDVRLAERFVFTGNVATNRLNMAGYDENGNFVKAVLRGTNTLLQNVEVVYDGSYTHLRACSREPTYSLMIYYRNRG